MNFKRFILAIFAILFALLSLNGALAYSYYYGYDYPNGYDGYAIAPTGYYYNTWTYGYNGWGYNRVYYHYHYPYSGYNYNTYAPYTGNYNGPNVWYSNQWVSNYPMWVAYPWPGYYW